MSRNVVVPVPLVPIVTLDEEAYRYAHWAARAERWRAEHGPAADRHEPDFEVFASRSVNLGLRLVYRQEWRPLGTQPGEIVRTIPLGPGQVERVTTKVSRRFKRSTGLESITSVETQTETSESTKDSSEIVNEAMRAWDVAHSHEVNVNWGVFSGKGTTSIGYKDDERSKETSSSLSEAMRKTAEKIRRETKVTVSTESEQAFESERYSEIRNPNNEAGITYEYLKLQHQYEVATRLAEMQMVVFVAEDLPTAEQLADTSFMETVIRNHDWIFAKVLRDESFREALTEASQNPPLTGDAGDHLGPTPDPAKEMLDRAKDKFASFEPGTTAQGGLSIPDIYSEPQRIYQEEARAKEERRRADHARRHRFERLRNHILQNLLYYFQAIWAHEPPDQRFLRYKKEGRRVPIEWRGPLFDAQIDVAGAASSAPSLLVDFTPTGKEAEVWEIIDPTGPLGYIGNYAVHALQPLALRPATRADRIADPVGISVKVPNEVVLGIPEVLAQLGRNYIGPNGTIRDPARELFRTQANEAVREDPAFLRGLTDDEVVDLVSYLPRLEDALLDADGEVIRVAGLLAPVITEADWAEYLYKKNGTRRFLVDTNNLYLDIHTSSGAALEPFKRAHRYLDVLRAAEDLQGDRLKNLRRATLVSSQGAFDPDIDKVVVVADHGGPPATTAAVADAMRASQAARNGDTEPATASPTPSG